MNNIPIPDLTIKEVRYSKNIGDWPSSIIITTVIDGVTMYQKYYADKRERGTYEENNN